MLRGEPQASAFDVNIARPSKWGNPFRIGRDGDRDTVIDVGTGTGVLTPLIQSYQPSAVLACDVAEKMLQRV